jgi:hypothetical protein
LALDHDGNPVVSYYSDVVPTTLRVVHCADPNCITPKVDPSCDGSTDGRDAQMILRYSAGLDYTVPCPNGADVNYDGFIDSVDALIILQYVAGLVESLHP